MLALFARLSPLQWCCGHGATLIGFFQKKKNKKKQKKKIWRLGSEVGFAVLWFYLRFSYPLHWSVGMEGRLGHLGKGLGDRG